MFSHHFFVTCNCSQFPLVSRHPETVKCLVELCSVCYSMYRSAAEEQWGENSKRKTCMFIMCVSAVLRILILLLRPDQKISFFPAARPSHFSPNREFFFENVRMHVPSARAYIMYLLARVPPRGESNFKVKGILVRQ